jgi:hypothetical protein
LRFFGCQLDQESSDEKKINARLGVMGASGFYHHAVARKTAGRDETHCRYITNRQKKKKADRPKGGQEIV